VLRQTVLPCLLPGLPALWGERLTSSARLNDGFWTQRRATAWTMSGKRVA